MSSHDMPHPPPTSSGEDNNLAMLVHLSGIILAASGLGWLVPLVVWLVTKERPGREFLTDHAREALNFQLTVLIAGVALGVVGGVLTVLTLGFLGLLWVPLFTVLAIAVVVLCILAGLAAQKGDAYRYPLTLRLVK